MDGMGIQGVPFCSIPRDVRWWARGGPHHRNKTQGWVVFLNMFYFHPYLGKISYLRLIFFKGVETTNQKVFRFHETILR